MLSAHPPFPQIDIIGAMVIVWRVRGKIIRSVLCNIVCNSCAQCNAHTHMNRPNSSLDWVLSHWAHLTVLRSCHAHCHAPFQAAATMLLPGEVTATAWLPNCDVVSARQCSYPVSALSGVHLPYRLRALSGGDDVTARQPDCGCDFAS